MFPHKHTHRPPLIHTNISLSPSSSYSTHSFFFPFSPNFRRRKPRSAPIPLSVWPTLLGTTQASAPLAMVTSIIIITTAAHHLAREKGKQKKKNNNLQWRGGKPPANLGPYPFPLNCLPFTDSQLDPVVSCNTQQFFLVTFISFFFRLRDCWLWRSSWVEEEERKNASNHAYSLTTQHNSQSIKLTTWSFVRSLLLLIKRKKNRIKQNLSHARTLQVNIRTHQPVSDR